ncbi:hypothetical protein AB0G85_35780 [Streptomyces sioyaensis]|uniref:hypothetical protein n=1 Tax=Streptomyces sioyaensis TaxID=67364 RepID=UPI00340EA19E
MYEMRADPATADTNEVTWHVMAGIESAGVTLCGRQILTAPYPPAGQNAVSERYCAFCMAAFRAAFGNGLAEDCQS